MLEQGFTPWSCAKPIPTVKNMPRTGTVLSSVTNQRLNSKKLSSDHSGFELLIIILCVKPFQDMDHHGFSPFVGVVEFLSYTIPLCLFFLLLFIHKVWLSRLLGYLRIKWKVWLKISKWLQNFSLQVLYCTLKKICSEFCILI